MYLKKKKKKKKKKYYNILLKKKKKKKNIKACSTCHVIIDPKFYSKLEEPSEDEEDLLELAFGLTDT